MPYPMKPKRKKLVPRKPKAVYVKLPNGSKFRFIKNPSSSDILRGTGPENPEC